MNNTQRMYDLGYSTVIGAKQLNPFCYFKSLQLIKERKTQYPSFDRFNLKRNNYQLPYQNIYVIESNKKFRNKIMSIRDKPVIPKMNTVYLQLDEIIKHNKGKIKEKNQRALTLENTKYIKRVKNQKPKILKANVLNKLFIENHDKYLEILLRNSRFRKMAAADKSEMKASFIKLPNISTSGSGSKNAYSSKMHSQTEYNLDDENGHSNNNSSIEQKDHKHNEISHQKRGDVEKNNN
jgi:hypothetical protein